MSRSAVHVLSVAVASACLAASAHAAPTAGVEFDQGPDSARVLKQAAEAAKSMPAVTGAPARVTPLSGAYTSRWQGTVDACQPQPPVGNSGDFARVYRGCFKCQVFSYILDFSKTQVGIQCEPMPREDDPEWRWENRTQEAGLITAPGHNGSTITLRVYEHYWERVRRERPDRDHDRPDRGPIGGNPGGGNPGGRDPIDRPERPELPGDR